MSSLTLITYAKELGLAGSGLLAGASLYISFFAVPMILHHSQTPPNIIHAQWLQMYNTGKAIFPVLSVISAAAFVFVSLNSTSDRDRLFFAESAISTLAIVPFTLLGMRKNLKALHERRKVWDEDDTQRLRELVKKWGRLNYVRAGLLTAAFVVGLVASVN